MILKSYKDLNLIGNPFKFKTVYDYTDFKKFPFLITESQLLAKNCLVSSFSLPADMPIYYVLIGERGIGKTSTLLWLLENVEQQNNESIVGKYERSIKGMGSIAGLVSKLLPDKRAVYYENLSKVKVTLESFLRGKKYYWFIDVPDQVTKKDMELLTKGLEILLGFKNVNVFISMNFSHYNKSFNHSEILGKFTPIKLEPFDLQQTTNLIKSRILSFSIDKEHPCELFKENAVETIWKLSKGIPRNILSSCDLLLEKFLLHEADYIDEMFVKNVLGEDLAKKIISERIPYDSAKLQLYQLYMLIKTEFNGQVEKQVVLEKKACEKFGWSRLTFLKKLKKLESLGLIQIDKSMKDGWSNIIKVVV